MRKHPIFPGQLDWLLRLYVDCHQAFLEGHPVDQALSQAFRKNKKMGSKDRRFYSTALFGLYRYWGWLKRIAREDPLLALYWAYRLEGQEPSALWSERLKLPEAETLPADLTGKLERVREVEPKAQLADLVPSFVPQPSLEILESLQARPRLWVRIQKPGPFSEKLAQGELAFERHPFLTEAVALEKSLDLKPYAGEVEIQDLSSQAVGRLCNPKPGEAWLDYCAGAGGKGLHLYTLMEGQGRLTLSDTRQEALDEAQRRFAAAGYDQAEFCWLDEQNDPLPDQTYDGVLVDVPCSGSGTWHRAPWLRWQLDEAGLNQLTAQQELILKSAATKLKPGGVLVYATCSILPEENQEITSAFRAAHSEFALEPFTDPLNGQEQPGERLILPQGAGGNGMYLCRMRRRD